MKYFYDPAVNCPLHLFLQASYEKQVNYAAQETGYLNKIGQFVFPFSHWINMIQLII